MAVGWSNGGRLVKWRSAGQMAVGWSNGGRLVKWRSAPSPALEPDHNLPSVRTIHLIGPRPTLSALSGESIPSPVGPLSFFLRPYPPPTRAEGGPAPSRCGLTLNPPMGGSVNRNRCRVISNNKLAQAACSIVLVQQRMARRRRYRQVWRSNQYEL